MTRLGAVVLVSATLLLVAGCGRDAPAVVGTTTYAPADRTALPTVAGSTLDGGQLDLADLRGRVVVLNSWASWCQPCRAEMPALASLADAADANDVAVVGLNVDDRADAAAAFTDEVGVTYPSIVDADGSILRTIPGVPPTSLPSTVVVDREGRIAATVVGEIDPERLTGVVDEVAAEPATRAVAD